MQGNGHKPVILVVDDEEGIRDIFKESLEEVGYLCKVVANGHDALDLMAREPVDLALVDMIMPGMSGMDLFRQMQVKHPDVGVVFVTALGELQMAVDTMRSGAYDYVTKPVHFDQLMRCVQAALEHRKARNEDRHRKDRLEKELDLKAGEVDKRAREITALNQMFQSYLHRDIDMSDMARRVAQVAERTSEELRKLADEAKRIAGEAAAKSN
ncbi:MAG: response regulator [Chloroflexi bacterium]|nr:response regulator [Chloroflexota bacterium]